MPAVVDWGPTQGCEAGGTGGEVIAVLLRGLEGAIQGAKGMGMS